MLIYKDRQKEMHKALSHTAKLAILLILVNISSCFIVDLFSSTIYKNCESSCILTKHNDIVNVSFSVTVLYYWEEYHINYMSFDIVHDCNTTLICEVPKSNPSYGRVCADSEGDNCDYNSFYVWLVRLPIYLLLIVLLNPNNQFVKVS